MSRPHPTKLIAIDSPTLPPVLLRRFTSPTFPPIKELPSQQTFLYPTSPTQQTFLHSPTASEISFSCDSPILPPPNQRLSNASYPTSTAGVYPTPRFSVGESGWRERYVSNWTDDENMVDGMSPYPYPRSSAGNARMSSILADGMGLYSELSLPVSPSTYTRRWSIAFPDGQQDVVLEEEVQGIELGPEVQGSLPVIREGDFMYYPLPSYVPVGRKVEVVGEWKGRKKANKKNVGRWLKKGFKKYGVKRFWMRLL